jgi:uncharacterized protein
MILENVVPELATTSSELPREALQWALEHWEEAGSHFVALLDAYASGADHSAQTERALFRLICLLGEKAETTAFAPLCRLLLDREASSRIFGDAITSALRGILISTYDGDLAALQAVIEAPGADDFVREGALLALAYLTRTGRVPETTMRAYLLHLLAEMQPQAEHFVWIGWLLAVAHLGYSDLAEQAEGLIRRGFVSERDWRIADFRKDLKRTLDDPERMAGFAYDRIGPFTDAIGELESWTGSSERDEMLPVSWPVQQPVLNPLRKVGRNDPCPCGSGKKFKKCCLAVQGKAS